MKQLLYIGPDTTIDSSQSVLLLEIGKYHLYFGIMSQANNELVHAGFYSWEESDEQDIVSMVFEKNPLLYNSFYQTLLSYHFPESLLVPDKYYNYEEGQSLLNNMYGIQTDSVVISEAVPECELYNIYYVPRGIHESISRQYSNGKYWHAYSVALKNLNHQPDEVTELIIDFKPRQLTVLMMKHNIFQFAQIFYYETSEDVLYYLLKICNQFSVSQRDVKIVIGGLIDQQSGIYIELEKYFLNLEFVSIPYNIQLSDSFKEHPQHFFSTIYKLSACVS